MHINGLEDRILDEFRQEIEALFPEIYHCSGGYGYSFHTGSLGANHCLQNSKYFLNPEGQEFFHLTSYRNLFSIINSGAFRLYNLKNSDDPNELESFRDVGAVDQNIEHYKQRTFILSGCQIDDLDNVKLWEGYGEVAIVYQVLNSAMHWRNFHFSKIIYEPESRFGLLKEILERFQTKYTRPFEFDTVPNLIAFHKNKQFEWEREVRLMYIPPLSPRMEEFVDFKTSEHHTGYTGYINLPLYVASDQHFKRWTKCKPIKHNLPRDFYTYVPHIKIKRIIFGDNEPKINNEKFNDLKLEFTRTFLEKFEYFVETENGFFKTGVKSKKPARSGRLSVSARHV